MLHVLRVLCVTAPPGGCVTHVLCVTVWLAEALLVFHVLNVLLAELGVGKCDPGWGWHSTGPVWSGGYHYLVDRGYTRNLKSLQ